MTKGHDMSSPEIPLPLDPQERREPLPEFQPKTFEEDPEAPARTQLLLDSPSYRRSDQDVDFLERDEAHGLPSPPRQHAVLNACNRHYRRNLMTPACRKNSRLRNVFWKRVISIR